MKKSILFCLLALFLFAGTQQANAQTKEETIAWIKEKLEKYLPQGDGRWTDSYSDIRVSPCSISWESERKSSLTGTIYKYSYVFNPSAGGKWSFSFSGKSIYAEADIVKVIRVYDFSTVRYSSFSFDGEAELDLGNRMAKALNHLATFCETKKEAF